MKLINLELREIYGIGTSMEEDTWMITPKADKSKTFAMRDLNAKTKKLIRHLAKHQFSVKVWPYLLQNFIVVIK